MAAFLEDLWLSIFTAGPTPTLLVATNAYFAALQLLLAALLAATRSIHFVILSVLTAGLWWAINWFATEIRAAQAKEEEAKRIREARREKDRGKLADGEGEDGGMDSGDDTEVDAEVDVGAKIKGGGSGGKGKRAIRPEEQSTVFVEKPGGGEKSRGGMPLQSSTGPVGSSTGATTTSLAPMVDDAVKKRKSLGESTGELSTDSEWEKLSQDSGDR